MEHVAKKYEEEGVSLIFINSYGKYYEEEIKKFVKLNFPIIEDDGYIRGLFNAHPEDTIIIDRSFNIKFKHYPVPKPFLFDEIIKWTFFEKSRLANIPEDKLSEIFRKLMFFDVINKERKKICLQNNKILIILFTSTCMGCEENTKIQLLKDISKKIKLDKLMILVLFGKGNNYEAIRKYAFLNDWNKYRFIVGVIEDSNNLSEEEYFNLFQLDVDPRIFFISSEGRINYAETRKSSKLINYDFILKLSK